MSERSVSEFRDLHVVMEHMAEKWPPLRAQIWFDGESSGPGWPTVVLGLPLGVATYLPSQSMSGTATLPIDGQAGEASRQFLVQANRAGAALPNEIREHLGDFLPSQWDCPISTWLAFLLTCSTRTAFFGSNGWIIEDSYRKSVQAIELCKLTANDGPAFPLGHLVAVTEGD